MLKYADIKGFYLERRMRKAVDIKQKYCFGEQIGSSGYECIKIISWFI